MDLSTTYLGMNLRTPLVPSASPLSETIDNIKQMEDAGASAVVLYSLFEEQLRMEAQELDYYTTRGTESFAEALSYFPEPDEYKLGPEEYLEHIRKAKDAVDIPIIASLNGSTRGGWTEFARRIEQAGANALELNIYYIPADIDLSGQEVENTYLDIVRSVKDVVSIPIAVKLSPFFSNLAHMATQLVDVGTEGLVLFNRFYQPDIDLERLEVHPHLLLSTPHALRLPLRWIAILYSHVKANFAATSGVHSAQDVIKTLMVGADVSMLCSALLRNGIGHIRRIEQDMIEWMKEHEYESVRQMQGSMSQSHTENPGTYERAQYMKALTFYQREQAYI